VLLVKNFPILPLEELARKAGKETGADRVASSATNEMKNVLLEISDKIAQEAVAASHHAKRVTIKRADILLAVR
jgi:histone H3/H4